MGGEVTNKQPEAGAAGRLKQGTRKAQHRPREGGPEASILALQNAAGNRAVSEALKPGAGEVPPIVESVINGGGGQALDAETRGLMERRLGYDFGDVRIHNDGRAAESAQATSSLAYTVGQHIVFGEGKYAPETVTGRELIAHELTHVVQQQLPGQAQPGSGHEQEANAAARHLNAGSPISVSRASASGAPQFAQDPSKSAPAPRLIFIDTNVIIQIEAGNTAVEAKIKELRAQGALIRLPQQVYNELIVQPQDPNSVKKTLQTLQRLDLKVGPTGTMPARTEVYTRNIADISGAETDPAKVRERQISKTEWRPDPILSEPDLVPEPGKKSKGRRNDVLVAAQVRAAGGELLTFDADFLQTDASKKPVGPKPTVADPKQGLGVKIAPESWGIKMVDEPGQGGGKPGGKPGAAGGKAGGGPGGNQPLSPVALASKPPAPAVQASAPPAKAAKAMKPAAPRKPQAPGPAPSPPRQTPAGGKPPQVAPTKPPAGEGKAGAKPPEVARGVSPAPGPKAAPAPKAKPTPPVAKTAAAPAGGATRGVATTYVPRSQPLSIGPTPRAQGIEAGAILPLQIVHWILSIFAEEAQSRKAQQELKEQWPNIQQAMQESGKGVLIFFEYTQPRQLPDAAVTPGWKFEGVRWQLGGDRQLEPATVRGPGETPRFTTQYVPPIKEAAEKTEKGAAEYRVGELWRKQRIYQKAGESYARENFIQRYKLDRRQSQIDLRAVYDARSELSSASTAIEQGRYADAQKSMDAAEELLARMRKTFIEYRGRETFD